MAFKSSRDNAEKPDKKIKSAEGTKPPNKRLGRLQAIPEEKPPEVNKLKDAKEEELYRMVELALLAGNSALKEMAMYALLESDNAKALAGIYQGLDNQNYEDMTEKEIRERKEIKERLRERLANLTTRDLLLGDRSKLKEVVIMLHNDENMEIRKMALHALMDYENPKGTKSEDEAIEHVLLYLRSEDDEKKLSKDKLEFKRYVITELDKARDYRYFDTFVEVLRFSSDPNIIDTIVTGLYLYGNTRAIDVLEYTANREDLDSSTRRGAANAAILLGLKK